MSLAASDEPRQRLDAAQRRLEIAHAAARVIIARGMHALRVQHVADEAKVSQPLVSQHFRSRDELISAAFVVSDQDAFDTIVDSVDKSESGREQLVSYLQGSLGGNSDVTRSWILWQQAWAYSSFSPELSVLINERNSIWTAHCASLIRTGREDGSIPDPINPDKAALQLMAMLDGSGLSLQNELVEDAAARRLLSSFTTEVLNGRITS